MFRSPVLAIFTTTGLMPSPLLTFVGASDPSGFDPRSGTVWSIFGPENVTVPVGGSGSTTFPETFWYLYGSGFDVAINALPTTGTITDMFHVVPFENVPAPQNIADLFVDYAFWSVSGLNLAADRLLGSSVRRDLERADFRR